jgi:DNA repair protein RadD
MRILDPRRYQLEAEQKVIAYAAEHPTGRVLVVIPPRGGKTFVGARLMLLMVVRQGLRGLWLVHREELLDEAVEHLVEVGIHRASIGVIKAGRSSDPDARVQVATEQTLDRRELPVAHLVVTDESHKDTAPRRRRIRRAYPRAFLLGLTGTPKPPPRRYLGEDYDLLLVVVQPSELIHDGHLAVPTVYAPARDAVPDLRSLSSEDGDYRPEDLEPLLLRSSMIDDQISEWHRLSEGRSTFVYPVTIAHSLAFEARFQALGLRARHLDGKTRDRRELLLDFNEGRVPVLISVGVVSEGTNVPRAKCVLGVRPTRSLSLYIQQMMRCATPWQDVRPRVLDGVGNCYEHGLPFADRKWSLKNEESGIPVGKYGGFVKRCPSCGAMMPLRATSCTGCLSAFPRAEVVLPEVPLELQEVVPGRSDLNEEAERLLAFARDRGFKKPVEWVADVLSRKYGPLEGILS